MESQYTERRQRLRLAADLDGGQALLVTHLPDVQWATGFSGSNGTLLITSSDEVLITDGRYREQVRSECPGLSVEIVSGSMDSALVAIAREKELGQVLFQGQRIVWSTAERLRSALADRCQVKEGTDPIPDLRAAKSDEEVAHIQSALAITEQVFDDVVPILREGISEMDLASEIDYRQRQLGASASAFETIVAFSDHAALPHARPGNRTLKQGDVILMDFGCVVKGYHSDMTRTVSFGRLDTLFLKSYEAVRTALLRAQERAQAGMAGKQLDSIARQSLNTYDLGAAFSHSLGHGVGLEIHESPSVSARNENKLPADCVITLEPGAYLPGSFGIRIENMVRLRPDGCTILNRTGTEMLKI